MLHLILKAYETSIVINLSLRQQSAEILEVVPEDEEKREKDEWWVTKKRAYATLGRLFHRWVDSSSASRARVF
ncbi:hypothetical protein GYMLUDRAFT_252884 [Collybiopsis luxurians FD-317 M1]|uniref:Uncharacterized protein n=1 Tax=Collybiopsis luxurians FD-317 M1 TaxID=944289 RepID=A0A0D0BMB5_9AGAR|nr:hypothetical protein GYMLUDRAFT_252884 [Collybiopsis luxurians FD-317 M1]